MKNLNITTGADYKVTHKLTKAVYLMKAQELADFVFRYGYKNYEITENKQTKEVKIRLIDRIPAWVLYTALIILTVASVLLHIQLNY
mgnify:CR=1 FL=1